MHLARRALSLSASATLELTARVAALKKQGVDVVSLGAGEPDFPSPPEAIAAANAFLAKGLVRYTPSAGLPELREAAAAALSRSTGVKYEAAQIVITNGAKEGLALALLATVQAGDEVLVPTPAWISYEPMIIVAEARFCPVPCAESDGFKLTPARLEAALTPKSRVLVLNSPNNPTGAVYTRAELAALAAVLAGRDITIVSDEIYSPFVFTGQHVSPAALPGLTERTVVVNGVSKSYSMTGWRIGYVGAPLPIAEAIDNLKSHLTSNAAAPSQYAALGALQSGDAYSRMMGEAFARRRRFALDQLAKLPGLSLAPPDGAFYVFPRVDALYGGRVRNSSEFCAALLEQERLAALPGAAFGEDRCIRFSIATSDELLAEGLARFARFVHSLRAGTPGSPNTPGAATSAPTSPSTSPSTAAAARRRS
ncbi:MAG: pyridoxal phosphate-dependent aminotransferase [Planctomycetota bacterium]